MNKYCAYCVYFDISTDSCSKNIKEDEVCNYKIELHGEEKLIRENRLIKIGIIKQSDSD